MSSSERVTSVDSMLEVIDSWLTEYISAAHPDIGRIGPICPFVTPSRKNRSMEVRVRFVGASPTLGLIEEIARSSLREFNLVSWQGRNPMLRTMIIAMPDLDSAETALLDEAHANVKDEFVDQGLMVGQFHENCTVPAARNEQFEVSKSPVPLLAIRSIALHDIFFLGEKRDWFEKYREKFGRFYTPELTEMDDQIRVQRYREVAELHGYSD